MKWYFSRFNSFLFTDIPSCLLLAVMNCIQQCVNQPRAKVKWARKFHEKIDPFNISKRKIACEQNRAFWLFNVNPKFHPKIIMKTICQVTLRFAAHTVSLHFREFLWVLNSTTCKVGRIKNLKFFFFKSGCKCTMSIKFKWRNRFAFVCLAFLNNTYGQQ